MAILRTLLGRRLVLPLVALGIVALVAHLLWDQDGAFLAIGIESISILFTVLYVDWVLSQHEKEAWRKADIQIRSRLNHSLFEALTSVRVALGVGAQELNLIDLAEYGGDDRDRRFLDIMRSRFVPRIINLSMSSNNVQWQRLSEAMVTLSTQVDHLLALFGRRLSPELTEGILLLLDNARRFVITHATFPDVLGVAEKELPEHRDGDAVLHQQALTRMMADDLHTLTNAIIELAGQ